MFFKILNSVDPNVIGRAANQAPTAEFPLPIDDPNLSRNFGFRKVDPNVARTPSPILAPGAKLTDLISTGVGNAVGLIISDKLKKLLLRTPHRGLQCFPMTIIYNGKPNEDYWETHMFDFDFQHINFSKSMFEVGRPFQMQPCEVADLDQYLAIRNSLKSGTGIITTKLVLNAGIDAELIILRGVDGKGYYVSGALKQAIEEANCTGLTFEAVEEA
jgi:hypothetical protein